MDKDSPKEFCDLCLIEGRRVVNIKNTYLHPLYEKLSNMKVESESCCMCFICHTRLRQCHQLCLLAERSTRRLHMAFIDPLEVVSKSKDKSLLELSQSETVTTFIPGNEVQNKSDVKQEERFFFYDREVQKKNEQIRDKCSEDAEELSESSLESELDSDNDEQPIKREVLEKRDEQLVAEPPDIPMDIQREDLEKADENFFAIPIENPDAQIKMESTHGVDICHIISVQKKKEQFRDKCSDDAEELSESSLESELDSDNDEQPIKREVLEKRDEQLVAESPDIPMDIQREDLQKADENFFAIPIKNPDAQIKMESMVAKNSLSDSHIKVEVERQTECPSYLIEYVGNSSSESDSSEDLSSLDLPPPMSTARQRPRHVLNPRPTIESMANRPHACDLCPRRFKLKTGLTQHRKTHTGEKPYSCEHCSRKFLCRTNLKTHLYTHTGEKPYSCDICQRKFTNSSQLRRHIPRHVDFRPFQCQFCDKLFLLKDVYQKHVARHNAVDEFRCDICQTKYKTQQSLRIHYRSHTGEKPYCCDVCGLRFVVKKQLERHATVHTNLKPFACQICPATFKTKHCLRAHEKRHTGDDRFTCNVCQRRFSHNCDLRNHMRTHIGDRPFACDYCPSKFYQRSTLNTHIRTHTGEKPYTCDVCQRKFTQKSSLTRHRRTHNSKSAYMHGHSEVRAGGGSCPPLEERSVVNAHEFHT